MKAETDSPIKDLRFIQTIKNNKMFKEGENTFIYENERNHRFQWIHIKLVSSDSQARPQDGSNIQDGTKQ